MGIQRSSRREGRSIRFGFNGWARNGQRHGKLREYQIRSMRSYLHLMILGEFSIGITTRKRPPSQVASSLLFIMISWLPTVDNLRNFFLTAPAEMLSSFHQVREAL